MKTRLFVPLLPALAILAFAAPAGAATSGSTSEAVSENWAGYEATTTNSSGFSAASGSWTQPTVSASSGQSYSAYWVGLGGGGENSSALEQEGTQADVSATGKVSYYAWYELVPSAPVKITSITVKPGDKIWARTAVSGDKVTVEVDNKTTGQDFKKTLTMSSTAPDTSTAEWVAEAPSECQGGASGECQPLPLSDFGSVKFTNAYATSNGSTKAVSGWTDTAIELSPESATSYGYGGGYGGGFGSSYGAGADTASGSSSEGAAPGALSSDGTSFTVTYGADSTATSGDGEGDAGTTGAGAGGYGYGASGYGDSGYGYGASGYGDSGYGYGYGGSGYVISGYGGAGYGGGYGYGYYGSVTSPYTTTGGSYSSESYYGGSYGSGAVYGY